VNKLGANDQERVQNSVQRLEYNFTDEKYIEANIKPIKQYKRVVTEKPLTE